MWVPILITVLAAAGNNIGKVLQKQATRTLPRLVLTAPVLQQYLTSHTWVLGTAADLSGALLMIVAFAYAPVSVVQPVSAVGLVILLVFSHFYLKERLKPAEWLAACIAFAGVLGLGVSAEPDHLDHPDHLHPLRIVGGFLLMVSVLGAECWWRHKGGGVALAGGSSKLSGSGAAAAGGSGGGSGRYHAPPGAAAGAGGVGAANPAALDSVLCGLEGGACFGFSAAACRTGFILSQRVSWAWAPAGLLGSIVLTSSGFVLQTRGLKAGSTVVVCTMAAVASMVTGVLAGLLALGEKMPTSHAMKVARLISWAAILLGVSSLAGGSDGLATAGRALAAVLGAYMPRLPAWVWRLLPRPVALVMHKAHKRLAAAAEHGGHDGGILPLTQMPSIGPGAEYEGVGAGASWGGNHHAAYHQHQYPASTGYGNGGAGLQGQIGHHPHAALSAGTAAMPPHGGFDGLMAHQATGLMGPSGQFGLRTSAATIGGHPQ